MKLKEFKDIINTIPDDFDDKEVKVVAENNMVLPAMIKSVIKDMYDPLNRSSKNTDYFIITW